MTVQSNAPTTGKIPGGVTGKGFVKGKSGNPGGRPKSTAQFGAVVRAFLDEPDETRPNRQAKLRTVIERMAKDDPKTLLAYGYGKPLETVQLQGPDGAPLNPLAGLTIVVEGAEPSKPREEAA